MSEQFSAGAVVIGAGVVGLAVARALALAGREVVILEKNAHIGEETSARNSEVIHAGIYYPKNSLKARALRRGPRSPLCFLRKPWRRPQATGQADRRHPCRSRRTTRSTSVVRPPTMASRDLQAAEPSRRSRRWSRSCPSRGGLFSPSTGIIDSHQYMLALLGDAEAAGASLVRQAEVTAIVAHGDGYRLTVRNAGEMMTLETPDPGQQRRPVGAEGRRDDRRPDPRFVPPTFLAKGNYATLSVKSPFRHLVYPVPEPGGLGVHLTLDMGGAARFGPNVEWLQIDDPAGDRLCRVARPARAVRAAHRRLLARDHARYADAGLFRRAAQGRRARKIPTRISASMDRQHMACRAWSICSASKVPA